MPAISLKAYTESKGNANCQTKKLMSIKTSYDGKQFDSTAEMHRWLLLKASENAGIITNLKRQVPFKLYHNGRYESTYYADFTYFKNKEYIVEDYKGIKTDIYKRKRELMKKCYNISILETRFRK